MIVGWWPASGRLADDANGAAHPSAGWAERGRLLDMIEMVGVGPFVVIPLVIKAMGGPVALGGVGGRCCAARWVCGRSWRGDAAGGRAACFCARLTGRRMGRMMSFYRGRHYSGATLLASGAIVFAIRVVMTSAKIWEKAISGLLHRFSGVVVPAGLPINGFLCFCGRAIGTILWLDQRYRTSSRNSFAA